MAPLEDPPAMLAATAPERPGTMPDLVSVIIPVLSEADRVVASFRRYHAALADYGADLEFIYVLGRDARRARAGLEDLKKSGAPLTIIVLSRWDGEVSAIRSGFRHARGATLLTLPAEIEIEDGQLTELLDVLDDGCDMAIGWRRARAWSRFDRLQNGVFHGLIRVLFGSAFNDLACRVRACRRQVFEEILDHSAQHQFLPLLATERGFEVREVPLRPSPTGTDLKGFGRLRPGARLRLVLDACALYVVLNYIRKPIRFFGAIGLPIVAVGVLFAAYLTFSRFWFEIGLADRPALILAVLLIVLGIQVIVLGLIGEIIIFASGRRMKDYTIDRII